MYVFCSLCATIFVNSECNDSYSQVGRQTRADDQISEQEARRHDRAGALTIRRHKFRRFAASVHV